MKYKWAYLSGFVFSVLSSLFQLYTPRVLKKVIDSLQPENLTDLTPLLHYCLYLVLIALGYGLFRFGARMMIIRSSRCIEYELRNEFLLRLQQQQSRVFSEKSHG